MRSFLLLALATPLLALGANRTTLSSSDGTKVSAVISGTGSSCAVLVHGDQRTAADWAPFAGRLVERGFRVVAPDLRGHGETGGPLDEATYTSMPQDVSAAVGHLAEHGCDKLAIVGSELGAVIAFQVAAADPRVTNLVLLSPRLSSHGLKVTTALEGYGSRPILMVTSRGDTAGARTAGALDSRLPGPHQTVLVDGDHVGPLLLNSSASLEGTMLSWLATNGDPIAASGTRTDILRTDDGGDLETTGRRLGEGL